MAVRNLPEMPCGPLLELQGQRKRFHIPYGLKPLMEDITLEVLRVQPSDVFEFLADFLEDRVRKKQEAFAESSSRRKSWLVHRWSWEASSVLSKEAFREFINFLPINEDNADHYATVIQAAFRGHVAREKVKEIKRSRKSGSEREEAFTEFLKALHITVEEADCYATKIQAAYRGFHTREVVKDTKGYTYSLGRHSIEETENNPLDKIPDEETEEEDEDEDQDGKVLFNSDTDEEGTFSEFDEPRIYEAIDSVTEEEQEESVPAPEDEMEGVVEIEVIKSGSGVIQNEETSDNEGELTKEKENEEEEQQ